MLNYVVNREKNGIFHFYIPVLILFIIFFFNDTFISLTLSLNLPVLTKSNKALILYNPNWWKKRKDWYNEMLFFKNNARSALFVLFCGCINFLVSKNLSQIVFFFLPKEYYSFEIASYECESVDLLTDIFLKLDSIVINNYSYFLIYIGIFSLIIPITVFSHSLAFKRLFIFTVVLFELSLILVLVAGYYAPQAIMGVWWTKYTPFNYWYGDSVGLSTTILNISIFFYVVSIILFSFIFFSTIFFKKSKYLSFFSVFKLCFLFLITFSFVIYAICWYEINTVSFLCCRSIRLEYLSNIVDLSSVYDIKLTYFNKGINAFYIFAPISIVFFFINQQIENNFDNYKKLIFYNVCIWIFLIIGSFLLLLFFRYFGIFKSFQFIIRFSFLVFCFGFLFFIFFKKIIYEMLLDFSFMLNLVFFNLCFYFLYYALLVPFFIKYDFLVTIINSEDTVNYAAFAFYNQLDLIINIIKFAPLFGFIHWYFDYFPSYKLNYKILIIEFIFLFFGIFIALTSSIRMLIDDLYNPVMFLGLYKGEYFGINVFEKQWIEFANLGFGFIYCAFIMLIVACILAIIGSIYKKKVGNLKKKNHFVKKI